MEGKYQTRITFYEKQSKKFVGEAIFDGTPKKTENEWRQFIKEKFPSAQGDIVGYWLKLKD